MSRELNENDRDYDIITVQPDGLVVTVTHGAVHAVEIGEPSLRSACSDGVRPSTNVAAWTAVVGAERRMRRLRKMASH